MNATMQPEKPKREAAHDLALFRQMLLIRRFEEKCAQLHSTGQIHGFPHLYIGEEAAAVGAMRALGPADNVVSTNREHGHALARGVTPCALMAELHGKANGCNRGRGGAVHLYDARLRFYGGGAAARGGLPIAVGLALADRLRERPAVTACFFSNGAVAEGEFHESLALAARWRMPVLFVCENTLDATDGHPPRRRARAGVARKAEVYGMPGEVADGTDVRAVEAAARSVVEAVRAGGGPALLELRTYRLRVHSMYGAELYHGREEGSRWKEYDPIVSFAAQLRAEDLLTDADRDRTEDDVAAEVAEAVAFAAAGPLEPVADLLKDVLTPVLR